jgi:septum formation protein
MQLVLASTSRTRAAVLRQAGVPFAIESPEVDEHTVQQTGGDAAVIARELAALKALAVSRRRPNAWVIGADQTLACDGALFTKPESRTAAAAQLAQLAGRTHHLHAAVTIARAGAVRWRYLASVAMTMRPLSAAEIDRYLDRIGDAATSGVGAYQIESLGIQLFERIGGDWFAILGLPLLPLLAYLRTERAIEL